MIPEVLLLFAGFTILILGADWLVKGSVSLARRYHISELAIGLTIVAFGTSSPELVVNIDASLEGLNDVTIGNIAGSNLFNIMLIMGVSGIILPLVVHVKTVWKEIPFSLLGTMLLWLLANEFHTGDGTTTISRLDGTILLLCFAGFLIYIFKTMKKEPVSLQTGYKDYKSRLSIVMILAGLGGLVLGSRLVVDNAVKIAHDAGISERVIGITIISAGTSLPELVTSVVAAIRKKSDIAVGNIIGSNIFNILFILGISSLIAPISFSQDFNVDLLLLMVTTALVFVFMFSGKKHKLDRWEAMILITGYAGYIIYLLI